MKHFNRTVTILVFIFLYVPMILLAVASFNTGLDIATFKGFTLRQYANLFKDSTLLTLLFDTRELADKFCAAMGTAPIAKSGWHVYNNMEQILDKKTWTDNHPFHLSDRTYEKHMLPQTDDILDRAVNISIGVVDKGLGSGCGININSTEEEINATAKHIREVIAGL